MEMPLECTETGLPTEKSRKLELAAYIEFDYKVKYSFKRFVFLSPIQGDVNLDLLLDQIFETVGYEAHKICYHGNKPSHIHVKYYNETNAREAVERFQNPYNVQGIRVAAIQLHDFLLSLYATECLSRRFPAWTLSVVDIEGTAEHCQPLSKDAVRNLLVRFGDPRIFSYNAGHAPPNHVQALFSSMAEALGASIAHGSWMRRSVPESPKFRYRIRLIGSEKECELMRRFSSNTDVDRIFEMDYFVGNNLAELSVPVVQSYPISEHFNQPQPIPVHRSGRNFNQSNVNYSRNPQSFRGRPNGRGRNYKTRTFPKQPQNQSLVVPDKNKSGSGTTAAIETLPEN